MPSRVGGNTHNEQLTAAILSSIDSGFDPYLYGHKGKFFLRYCLRHPDKRAAPIQLKRCQNE